MCSANCEMFLMHEIPSFLHCPFVSDKEIHIYGISYLFSLELSVVCASPVSGAVDEETVVAALRPNTALVSVMLANNETGVIQPVRKIAKAVRRWQRETGGKETKVFIHTDAAQVCEWTLVINDVSLLVIMMADDFVKESFVVLER